MASAREGRADRAIGWCASAARARKPGSPDWSDLFAERLIRMANSGCNSGDRLSIYLRVSPKC